jgi:hypothetical protein
VQFFAGVVDVDTAGVSTARMYGNITCELTLAGNHLAVVQQCAIGEDAEFITTLRSYLESRGPPGEASIALHSIASADAFATSVVRNGPPLVTIERLHTPILFVLSSPRSGSSLLQLCLQVHQELYAGQELHLLLYATMRERRRLCPFELLEGLVKTVAEVRMCNLGDAAVLVASWEEYAAPVWSIFRQLLCDLGGTHILVDKSPPYVNHPSYLDHAHVIFGPAACYVHLVRHPYACIQSGVELAIKYVRNDAFNLERGGDPGQAWPSVELLWVEGQTNANEFVERICREAGGATPRAQRVFYEDLLCVPSRVLAEICRLVEVEYEPSMVEPYETEAVQTFRSVQSVSTTDPKLLRRKKIDAAQADKWRRVELPHPLSEAALVLARDFGYMLEGTG